MNIVGLKFLAELAMDFFGRLVEGDVVDFHDQVEDGAAAAMGKAMKEVFVKVDMEGIDVVALVNRARSRQVGVIFFIQADVIVFQYLLDGDPPSDAVHIQIHGSNFLGDLDDNILIYDFELMSGSEDQSLLHELGDFSGQAGG